MKLIDEERDGLRFNVIESGDNNAPINKPKRRV